MEYTITEKVEITAWAICLENIEERRRRFVGKYGKEAPLRRTISDCRKKLLETGSLATTRTHTGRKTSVTGDDNTRDVLLAVAAEPATSTRRLSSELNISVKCVSHP